MWPALVTAGASFAAWLWQQEQKEQAQAEERREELLSSMKQQQIWIFSAMALSLGSVAFAIWQLEE